MAATNIDQTLSLSTTFSNPGTEGSQELPTNIPDYGMKIVDVVLNSNRLTFVTDATEGNNPPSSESPYQSLKFQVVYQELPNGDRLLLADSEISNVDTSRKQLTIDLASPASPISERQYKIEIHVEGRDNEGNPISFNNSGEFVANETVRVSSN